MEKQIIDHDLFRVWLEEDGIIRSIIKAGAEFTLKGAQDLIEAYAKVSQGKTRPVFHDISAIKSADRDARNYVTSRQALEVINALGVIVNSPVSRVIGNFFLGINKPSYPTKLFTAEAEGLEWLKGFL